MLRLHTYHPFVALTSLCILESMPIKSIFEAHIADDNARKGKTDQETDGRVFKEASRYVGENPPPYHWKASNR